MNIFPNRKSQTNFNKKITNKKSNIILKTKVEKFPSSQVYKNLNNQLLKQYLKMTLETKIESKICKKITSVNSTNNKTV